MLHLPDTFMSFYTMLMLPLLNVGEERRMVCLRENEQEFAGLRAPRYDQQLIMHDAGKGHVW